MNLIAVFLVVIGKHLSVWSGKLSSTIMGSNFPYATLCSNVLSTLVLAYFIYFFHYKMGLSNSWKLFVVTGFVVDLAPSLPLVLKLLRC